MGRSPRVDADPRFEEFFRDHHERVRRYVARRVGSALVDDAVSQTFVVAWRKFARCPTPSLAWVLRIASFELRNVARRERLQSRATAAVSGSAVTIPEAPDVEGVRRAMELLSARDQEILRLVHWDDLGRGQIAEVLSLSVSAVNVRYHRAKARLEALLPRREGSSDTEVRR